MKIKYLNTNIISSILSFTLITSSLTGCTNELLYKRNNDGTYLIEGTINNNNLKDYCILEVFDKISNTNKIFLVRRIKLNSYFNRYRYKDIISNIDIFTIEVSDDNKITYYDKNNLDTSDDSLHTFDYIREIPLEYYLIIYEIAKYEYSYEDLEDIFNIIKEDYYQENNNKIIRNSY